MAERINEVLAVIGKLGRYQWWCLFWTGWVMVLCSCMQVLISIFTQADMTFRCNDAYGAEDNSTVEGSCYEQNSTATCRTFTYSSTVFTSTVFSEFNLVCDRQWLRMVLSMAFMAVRVPVGPMAGIVIDRFGRKKPTIVLVLLSAVCGLGAAFSVTIEMYIIFRVALSTIGMVLFDTITVLVTEVSAPDRRPHVNTIMNYWWAVGILLTTPLAFWLRNWRHLQLAVSVPALPLGIILIWTIDESPHWLVSQDRLEEAQKVINKIAAMNKQLNACDLNVSMFNNLRMARQDEESKKVDEVDKFIHIFKAKRLLAYLLIASCGWFACQMIYYGMTLTVGGLAGDIYWNNFISGTVEMVAYSICFAAEYTGRKKLFIGLLTSGGLSLIAFGLILLYCPDVFAAVIVTNMAGHLAIASGWVVFYIWCLELFPTTVRARMMTISIISGNLGATLYPLLTDIEILFPVAVKGQIVAPMFFGVVMLLAAGSAVYLPETMGQGLPVTIAEANNLKK